MSKEIRNNRLRVVAISAGLLLGPSVVGGAVWDGVAGRLPTAEAQAIAIADKLVLTVPPDQVVEARRVLDNANKLRVDAVLATGNLQPVVKSPEEQRAENILLSAEVRRRALERAYDRTGRNNILVQDVGVSIAGSIITSAELLLLSMRRRRTS